MQSHGARGSLPASRMAPALDLARLGVLPVALVSALAQLPPLVQPLLASDLVEIRTTRDRRRDPESEEERRGADSHHRLSTK